MATPEIAITGVGVLSPIGCSVTEVHANLLALRSGISLWRSEQLREHFAAGRVDAPVAEGYTNLELPFLERTTLLALSAARQASADSGITDYSAYGCRAGLFYATVRGGSHYEWDWLRQHYLQGRQTARPNVIMASMPNAAAAQISIRSQILGPVATHTSACSSSGATIADACRHLITGEVDIALAGGAESPLSPEFLGAWGGLRAMADVDEADVARSCKPFAMSRTGLVLSEGAVFFVLETVQHARQRGAPVHGIITGWGAASDAYHVGQPHSRGQTAAMRLALEHAGLDGAQLAYVNAHGTGTRGGDPIEVASLKDVLGPHARNVPVSSTKAQHGHMLGAASAMELLVCLLAVKHSFLPATAHLDEIAPDCDGLLHVQQPKLNHAVKHAMSLSAGFGGTNVALIVSANR